MTARRTFATAGRVLRQLRHDPRTIALLLVVPVVLMGLLAWIFPRPLIDPFGPLLLGIFPLLVMFLVTSVATLRERTGGTLERLMATPLGKGDFVAGYALAFGTLGLVQAVVVSVFTFGPYGFSVTGSAALVGLVAVIDAILGTAIGLCLSALAQTEFQAVQFMPIVLIPQLLLCGLFVPVDALPGVLQPIAAILPLTYAIDATRQVVASPEVTAEFWRDIAILVAFVVAFLAVGALTLRRRTP